MRRASWSMMPAQHTDELVDGLNGRKTAIRERAREVRSGAREDEHRPRRRRRGARRLRVPPAWPRPASSASEKSVAFGKLAGRMPPHRRGERTVGVGAGRVEAGEHAQAFALRLVLRELAL